MNRHTLTLESSDGRVLSVPRDIAMLSETISSLIEDVIPDDHTPIPLYSIDYETLKRVVSWMVRHSQEGPPPEVDVKKHDGIAYHIRDWERVMFAAEERSDLFRMMNAANYLQISPLLKSSTAYVAEKVSSLSVDEARDYLNLVDDYTPEEKERIRLDSQWVQLP
ncbi:hypothetical protein AB6A40_001135 [Gnathostoma spinigerum]|uniref:Skp1-related protein n=1 Tax=Gnathostoma spinigerum TaxID=75299 RepID=A0ABD6EAH9_9BILA